MSINEIVKKFPKAEEVCLQYNKPGGIPLYVVTKNINNGSYKLYGVEPDGYRFLKSRKDNPLFKEVLT